MKHLKLFESWLNEAAEQGMTPSKKSEEIKSLLAIRVAMLDLISFLESGSTQFGACDSAVRNDLDTEICDMFNFDNYEFSLDPESISLYEDDHDPTLHLKFANKIVEKMAILNEAVQNCNSVEVWRNLDEEDKDNFDFGRWLFIDDNELDWRLLQLVVSHVKHVVLEHEAAAEIMSHVGTFDNLLKGANEADFRRIFIDSKLDKKQLKLLLDIIPITDEVRTNYARFVGGLKFRL